MFEATLFGAVRAMQDPSDDAALLRRQHQFLHEIEQGIRQANREIIHARIPELDRERFLEFALMVARLRAGYLEEALRIDAGDGETALESFALLRRKRQSYEEARDAFDALERAIQRGYVDIDSTAAL